MAHQMSVEVLDDAFLASLSQEADGDRLVQAAVLHGVIDWKWRRLRWGVMLQLSAAAEQTWERFRPDPAVVTALESVPDRACGLVLYRSSGAAREGHSPPAPSPLRCGRRRRAAPPTTRYSPRPRSSTSWCFRRVDRRLKVALASMTHIQ